MENRRKKTNRQLKRYAMEAFQLKPGMAIGAAVSVFIIQLGATLITSVLFPVNTVMSIVLGEIFSLALTVLTCLFEAGMYYMFLCLSRGEESWYGQLLWFFQHDPDRIILASTVMAVITWITSLPFSIYNYTAAIPATQEQMMQYFTTSGELYLLSLALGTLIMVPFRLTYYILADEPETSSMEALKKSRELMKGNFVRFVLLQVSFLPWIILSVVAMYIPMLYVLPYMELTNVALYRDIRGEYILYHPPVPDESTEV